MKCFIDEKGHYCSYYGCVTLQHCKWLLDQNEYFTDTKEEMRS